MHAMSRLRNDLVHNAAKVTFAFESHLKESGQRSQFVKDFGRLWLKEATVRGRVFNGPDLAAENPRPTLWMLVVYILAEVHVQIERFRLERDKAAFKSKQADSLEELLRKILPSRAALLAEGAATSGPVDG